MAAVSLVPSLRVASDVTSPDYDGVLAIISRAADLTGSLQGLGAAVSAQNQIDKDSTKSVFVLSLPDVSGKRLVVSPTGAIDGDFDDVRTFYKAAQAGIKRALKAGIRRPVVVVAGGDRFQYSRQVALLGVMQALYTPLEIRETDRPSKVEYVGLFSQSGSEELVPLIKAVEAGRIVCRDIGGSDPERMAPPAVAKYVQQMFANTCVQVDVLSDDAVFQKEYPLLAAVNRCARNVERHQGRVINLTYTGEGEITETLLLVGKGITYDTGGADLKAGGVMAGMSRDKCGAAFVAGFFQLLSVYKPRGLKVLGAMCMVRNSIGSDCYVSDEIITSRAGVRVRVGNTDAEGRMVMTDVLCHMKERALSEVNPHIFTVATLTGHVIRCYGENYAAAIDNGPAWAAGTSRSLVETGDNVADPFEISRLRREDFEFNLPPTEYEDVVQANNLPSTLTSRGHQYPAAFMITASGLDKHGSNSSQPLRYTHMDVAGAAGAFPYVPTAAPMITMAHRYVLNKPSAAN